ncbi:MAG TPA: hypothetical protein VFI31_00835 [Pirellulales bacterium]|nr:hypothetical protein [Pirellulales bacterium]
MNAYTPTQVHHDHHEWTEERALWHDDIRVWEEEVDELLAKLQRIAAVLTEQKHSLRVHGAALRLYEQGNARCEHLLAECERYGNDERECILGHAHEGEVQRQDRQRERHEELKASQRRLMSDVRPLTRLAETLPPTVRH